MVHELARLTRRRTGAKLGRWLHAPAHVVVDAVLMALAALHAQTWTAHSSMGCSLGRLNHGAVFFLLLLEPTDSLHNRLSRERFPLGRRERE